MDRPWMQFFTRDWLDCKELGRCSPFSQAILVRLMCIAHEGKPYGFLADSSGPLTIGWMAARCVVTGGRITKAIAELKEHTRLAYQEPGGLFVPRMVEDEAERLRRQAAGRKGGNPNLLKLAVNHGSYPPPQPPYDSDSVCVSSSGFIDLPEKTKSLRVREECSPRFPEFWEQYPLKKGEDLCAGIWVSIVGVVDEPAVFACLARYLASDQVARGAVMNPNNWLHDCSRDRWKTNWPAARKNGGRETAADRVLAQMHESIARGESPL